ncbi:MAG: cytidine deaminase, partial [Phycisphaerales bacterium JB059]
MAGMKASTSSSSKPETGLFSVKDLDAQPTEVVIAVVGALGVDHSKVRSIIADRLQAYSYSATHIRISKDVICEIASIDDDSLSKYERATTLIDKGNEIRKSTSNEILATATAAKISERREEDSSEPKRLAFVVSSLKHPEEVAELRRIYGRGFFLFAVHRNKGKRVEHLMQNGGMTLAQAETLIKRDEDEAISHGQHMRDTFHLADFFIHDEGIEDKLKYSIERCLDLVFGKPSITPTFNEFAMYMAFASSLR